MSEMNLGQAVQLLNWLDEQHREDRRQLDELREAVERQEQTIGELRNRLQDSEGRSAQSQARLQALAELPKAIDQVKADVVLTLRSREEEWRKQIEAEAKGRRSEHERVDSALAEVNDGLRGVQRFGHSLESQASEIGRLRDGLSRAKSEMDEAAEQVRRASNRLDLVEAGRSQDEARTEKNEQAVAELLKRVDQQAARAGVLEERQRAIDQVRSDMDKLKEQTEKAISRLAQEQRVKNAGHDKEIQAWADQIKGWVNSIQAWESDQRRYASLHKETESALDEIKDLERRLGMKSEEIAEAQRLGAERLEARLGDAEAAQTRRWRDHQQEAELAEKERRRREEERRADSARLEAELRENNERLAELREALGDFFVGLLGQSEEAMGAFGAGELARRRRGQRGPSKAELRAAAAADVRVVEGGDA